MPSQFFREQRALPWQPNLGKNKQKPVAVTVSSTCAQPRFRANSNYGADGAAFVKAAFTKLHA